MYTCALVRTIIGAQSAQILSIQAWDIICQTMSFITAYLSEATTRKSFTVDKSSSESGNLVKTHTNSSIYLEQMPANQGMRQYMSLGNEFDFTKIGIQPKLKISQPDDESEKEADLAAEQVMRMTTIASSSGVDSHMSTNNDRRLDRKCAACEMKEKEDERKASLKIRRKPSAQTNFEASDEVMHDVDTARSSSGSPLDAVTKEFMESRFGFDFSNVRIHTNENAARSANLVNALAYTVGNDIMFGEGQYQPDTFGGKKLLAHELTHVVQSSPIGGALSGDLQEHLMSRIFQDSIGVYDKMKLTRTDDCRTDNKIVEKCNVRNDANESFSTESFNALHLELKKQNQQSHTLRRFVEPDEGSDKGGVYPAPSVSSCVPDRPLTWNDYSERSGIGKMGAETRWTFVLQDNIIKAQHSRESWVRPKFKHASDRHRNGCAQMVNQCQRHLGQNPGGTSTMSSSPSVTCSSSIVPNSVTATTIDECNTVIGAECDRAAVEESARLLRHEQTHFDIACILAAKGNDAIFAGQPAQTILHAVAARSRKVTSQYDTDSDHGCDQSGQISWSKDVDAGLPNVVIP